MAWSPLTEAEVRAGDITGGKKAPHVNIAVFHALHGQEGYKFPAEIKAHDVLNSLEGKAQFIFMNHTAGLKDGDVISVATDVLRDEGGKFEDFGIDCQMTVHLKGNADVLSGICEILMLDQDGREIEHNAIIKPTSVASGNGWTLLHFDAEDGIAIYASADSGME
ncbi:MAG: hypothetical protein Q9M30_07450, partial [Mariprofundaceae bacterium]|nr:hypothetical protein [Mariprofundaceae bacterium]